MTIRAVTLDVYSALFDTVSGLTAAVTGVLRRRNAIDDPRTVARRWRQKHAECLLVLNSLDRAPASNREAIEIAARFALRDVQPPLAPWNRSAFEVAGMTERCSSSNDIDPATLAGLNGSGSCASWPRRAHSTPAPSSFGCASAFVVWLCWRERGRTVGLRSPLRGCSP